MNASLCIPLTRGDQCRVVAMGGAGSMLRDPNGEHNWVEFRPSAMPFWEPCWYITEAAPIRVVRLFQRALNLH